MIVDIGDGSVFLKRILLNWRSYNLASLSICKSEFELPLFWYFNLL